MNSNIRIFGVVYDNIVKGKFDGYVNSIYSSAILEKATLKLYDLSFDAKYIGKETINDKVFYKILFFRDDISLPIGNAGDVEIQTQNAVDGTTILYTILQENI